MTNSAPARRVVVVGAGISGLAAAHRLGQLDPQLDVTLLEASNRAGGIIETTHREGWLIERSADGFLDEDPLTADLCRQLGLGEELIGTSVEHRGAYVVHRGQLARVPAGFRLMSPGRLGPLLASPILSLRGKLRLLREFLIPRRSDEADESLASFARRRLGREAYERLVEPLVAGIYAGDGEQLSMAATMPRFALAERNGGGLIRDARRRGHAASGDSAARYGLMRTLRGGLQQLTDALAASAASRGRVEMSANVLRLSRTPEGLWHLHIGRSADDPRPRELVADAVIVTTAAPRAAKLLHGIDQGLSDDLNRIESVGTAVAAVGYRAGQIEHPLDAFGLVVPRIESRRLIAVSFSSVKYPGRAPEGHVLLRCFLGGALHPELVEADGAELRQTVRDELAELLGVQGEPVFWELARWPRSMPQYRVGHLELVARIEGALSRLGGLALAGSAYRGVGIPQCIRSGYEAAEGVLKSLSLRRAMS